ncbi:flavodoxin family protein [Proteobacteria bacterium 005FR1]|nr:flavodoxin family protein [Proteobacteria bacterium 005FR1]
MNFLIVYFSYTGNNRLLAEELSERLDCDSCPVVEKKSRTDITNLLDMVFRREPKLEPLALSPANYDHIVFVAPLWNAHLANPMSALIKRERASIHDYSFITFSGYHRPGQPEQVGKQLRELTGKAPEALTELAVTDLLPERDRKNVRIVSNFLASPADLNRYESQIDDFLQQINPAVPWRQVPFEDRPGIRS